MGRWFDGRRRRWLKPTAGIAKPAAVSAPWHWAQLPVVLGALAWMSARLGMTAKSLLLWQALQAALVAVGMWLAGLSTAVKASVLPWHCTQSPVAGCAASATLVALPAAVGRVWKPLYCAPTVMTAGEMG